MKNKENLNLEDMMFQYMDQIKYLISPELWSNEVLNCSKNEVFILLLLYRKEIVNMTQIADYIGIPLNTATGIVARMEKKKLLYRMRSKDDKRVVMITMTEEGKAQIKMVIKEILNYATLIFDSFTPDEVELTFRLLDKVLNVLHREQKKQTEEKEPKKKVRRIRIE